MLTPDEHEAMRLSSQLANTLGRIVANGAARPGDITELVAPLHMLQRSIMAQAAARQYPDQYRLLGLSISETIEACRASA